MKLMMFHLGADLEQAQLDALGKLVQSKRPEFLGLQNVTNETIKKVVRSNWGSRYNVVQPQYKFETRKKPTVALFSTYPSQDSSTLQYKESACSRIMQKGYYVMYDKQKQPYVICVSTTSLESGLKASKYRESQLNQGLSSMIGDEDAFVLGDFSLDDDIDGELILKGGWKDVWLEIPGNTKSSGYTYHPVNNPLIKEDPFGPGRPDRIFFKTRHYKLDSVELVGVEPCQLPGGVSVTISKHYGLMAQFSPLDVPIPAVQPPETPAVFKKTEWSIQFEENKELFPQGNNHDVPTPAKEAAKAEWSIQFQQSS